MRKVLVDKKYNRWTAKEDMGTDEHGNARWWCRCECGTERAVLAYNLLSGKSKSCGCLQKLSPGQAAANSLLSKYKSNAADRGLSFELTREQFFTLTKQNCHYCDAEPSAKFTNGSALTPYIYNGIDRVNNNEGYALDNVVPCCKVCNRAKNNMTYQEFSEWLDHGSRFRFKKEWDTIKGIVLEWITSSNLFETPLRMSLTPGPSFASS